MIGHVMKSLLRYMVMMRTNLIDPMKAGWRWRHCVLTATQQRRRNARQIALVLIYLGQALYPQRFGHTKKGSQPILVDAHLATIHKVQKTAHVHVWNILEDDYRVFVRMTDKQGLQTLQRLKIFFLQTARSDNFILQIYSSEKCCQLFMSIVRFRI